MYIKIKERPTRRAIIPDFFSSFDTVGPIDETLIFSLSSFPNFSSSLENIDSLCSFVRAVSFILIINLPSCETWITLFPKPNSFITSLASETVGVFSNFKSSIVPPVKSRP